MISQKLYEKVAMQTQANKQASKKANANKQINKQLLLTFGSSWPWSVMSCLITVQRYHIICKETDVKCIHVAGTISLFLGK